jgi:hypothetical protein
LSHRLRPIALTKIALIAGTVATLMALSTLGADVTNAGANSISAGSSSFCKNIKTFAVAEPPVFVTISTYHVWAKLYLPSYERLASEAPNAAVKKLLNETVAILKYEEKATNLSKLKKYVAAHRTLWNRGVTSITQSDISCATTT